MNYDSDHEDDIEYTEEQGEETPEEEETALIGLCPDIMKSP